MALAAPRASRSCRNGARTGVGRAPGLPATLVRHPGTGRQRWQSTIARAENTAVIAGPVKDSNFKELVLDSPVPVLVDFWAPWCGPCRMIGPLIDELAVDYKDRLLCVKLNTDESPSIATQYGIRSIPTVMIFKNGKKMETVIGAVPKSTLIQTVDKFL